MRARTKDGREIDLSQDRFDGLKARLRGPVFTPGDAGYEESRTVWNAMIDRKPAVVVRCLGIADVIACVRFARENELLLCIKGGGHNIAGLATADGALMLDMSLMRGVWVDPQRRIAHAQAGCLLGDVDRETQVHGLAAVLGFVSLTGIAGLTLGGGFGYLTRRWGWTSDNVTGMDIVTADARLLRASRRGERRPLLGAARRRRELRRGDRHRLRAAPRRPGDRRRRRGLAGERGARRSSSCTGRSPRRPRPNSRSSRSCARRLPAPWLPKDMHGKPIVALLACYSGQTRGGREGRRPDQVVRHARSVTCSCAGRTRRCSPCSTPRSRRAGATTGRASTSRVSSRRCARRSSSTPPGSARLTRR